MKKHILKIIEVIGVTLWVYILVIALATTFYTTKCVYSKADRCEINLLGVEILVERKHP